MVKAIKRWLALLLCAATVALVVVRFIGNPQKANMAKGEAHLPRIREILHSDSRFSEVTAEVFTGQNGSIAM